MPISKKQFEFAVRGRVVAINSTAALTLANLQVVVEGFALDGTEYDLMLFATVGTGNEHVTYPTIVADRVTPATTAALAATATAVKAAIGTLKAIT